jgi:hypothetical protein
MILEILNSEKRHVTIANLSMKSLKYCHIVKPLPEFCDPPPKKKKIGPIFTITEQKIVN